MDGWRGALVVCSTSPHMTLVGTPLSPTCPQLGALIHTFSGLIHTGFIAENRRFFAGFGQAKQLVGVQHLPQRSDVAPEVVVLRHLALDLFAAVQHGQVVAPTQRLADPEQRSFGLLAHQVHRYLSW